VARIPDAVIQRLKQEVSLERLVLARGIELKRHGKDLLGPRPHA
jgi:DNA primase